MRRLFLCLALLAPTLALAAAEDTRAEEATPATDPDVPVVLPEEPAPEYIDDGLYEVLHRFEGPEGWQPFSSLFSANGLLYGTAHRGGADNHGVIFSIDPVSGEYRVLHDFKGPDGSEPMEGLAIEDNVIYGTTKFGGETNYGVLFKFNTDGSGFEVLYNFAKSRISGFYPHAGPIYVDGTLYGTAYHGGATLWGGVVYAFDLESREFRIVQSMDARSGRHPTGRLLPVGDWLYGLSCDFDKSADGFYGSLFRIHKENDKFEVIHMFEGRTSGGHPYGTLVADSEGRLYGTTFGEVWQAADPGVIFSVNADGSDYTVIYDFAKSSGSGSKPNGGLVFGPERKWLYGQTHGDLDWGGVEPGTLFRLRPDGSEFTVLHRFNREENGMIPMREPLLHDNAIYGVTAGGGRFPEVKEGEKRGIGGGVIFRHQIPASTKY